MDKIKSKEKVKEFDTILCEGSFNSLDYRIYSLVFSDKLIIPCGAHSKLKIQEMKLSNRKNIYAITDRDILTLQEIEKLKTCNIYTTKVRAIENILVADKIIEKVCTKLEISQYLMKIEQIKQVLFEKYGKKLNKSYDFTINNKNILEYYTPKKVIDTVSKMLGVSKTEYEEAFFVILKKYKRIKEQVRQYLDL